VTQQHTEHLVQIFSRLVVAKLTGSLSESARAYSDLDTLADHVAIIQEHNGYAAPAALQARRAQNWRRRPSAPAWGCWGPGSGRSWPSRGGPRGRRPRWSPIWPVWERAL